MEGPSSCGPSIVSGDCKENYSASGLSFEVSRREEGLWTFSRSSTFLEFMRCAASRRRPTRCSFRGRHCASRWRGSPRGAAVREPRQRALPHGGGRSAVQHLASGVECVRANGGRVEPRQAKEPRDRAFWAIGGGKRRYDLGRDEAGHRLFLDKRARDQGNALHRSKLRGVTPTNP